MKLLLDTHVWLWSILESSRLSPAVRNAIASRENELWLSPISLWETLLLAERGRIELDGDPHAWIGDARNATPTIEAPLTFEVALASRTVSLPHEDPADRFIAASARVYNLVLVTADRRLSQCLEVDVFRWR